MIRVISIVVATLLSGYILFASFYFSEERQDTSCESLQVVVKDSLDKHFISESDLVGLLKKAQLDPRKQPMKSINTELIEKELLKNEMILTFRPTKRHRESLSWRPISPRYVAHVPVVSGYVEKSFAVSDLYKFALFLQGNEFWNDQIEQIYVHPDQEVELVPRVGNHRIILGTLEGFEEKLEHLKLFYEQAIPKMGWEKYSMINLKYKNQIVCTKK